jgi:Tfp pilus assembly protein PilF
VHRGETPGTTEGPAGEPRFTMLETIREYGLERLARGPSGQGEAAAIGRAHADYYLALAEDSERGLRGAGQKGWLARLEAERDNLRAALVWALAHDTDTALRLCGALDWFWLVRGTPGEGHAWAERALTLPGAAAYPAYARALLVSGILTVRPSDAATARPRLEQAVALLREQQPRDEALLGRGLAYLAAAVAVQDGPAAALEVAREGAALVREAGDEATLAEALLLLGLAHLLGGDHAAARPVLEESYALYQRQGDLAGVAWTASGLGDIARIEGDYARAGPLHEESLARRRELGERGEIAAQLHNLAYVAVAQGDLARARGLLEESLALQRELGNPGGFAAVAAAEGQAARAARMLGAAAAIWEGNNLPLWPAERAEYERTTARARAGLDEATWQRAWDEGRAMTTEQAVEAALSVV